MEKSEKMKTVEELKTFDEYISSIPWNKDDLCPPPMDAQICLDYLSHYLLGDGYVTALPLGRDQVNTVVTSQILEKYSKRLAKERRKNTILENFKKLLNK